MSEVTNDEIACRAIGLCDLDVICAHREKMFLEMGRSGAAVNEMKAPFREWLHAHLLDARYFGFMLAQGEMLIGGVGLMEIDWPPHPAHPQQAKRGYALNLYIEPAFRKRGLARRLMQEAEAEFKRRDMQYVVLHAAAAARHLYQGMGWTGTTEMSKSISSF